MTLTAVLTRPGGAVESLSSALSQRGVDSIVQPLVDIAAIPVEDRELITLHPGDICIFISANAVDQGLANLAPQLQAMDCPILAVGNATARAVAAAGFDVSVPERADSEGLLALDVLHDVQGKQVVIIKGEGGRGLLAEALKERGALVVSYVCYRREAASVDAGQFCWQLCEREHLVFQASSGELLEQLTQLLGRGGQPNLLDSPVVVPSDRVAEIAEGLGWTDIKTASGAGDEAFLAAVDDLLPAQQNEEPAQLEEREDMTVETAEATREADEVPTVDAAPAVVAKAPVEARQTSVRGPDRLARFIIVLFLLAAGAGAYLGWWYGWPQYQDAVDRLAALEGRLTAIETAPDQRAAAIEGSLATQMAAAEQRAEAALRAAAARQSQLLAEQDGSIALLKDRVERLDVRLARLTATDRRAWLANEAAFLVRLSAQRLLTSRDIAAAEALLTNADALLSEVDDPRFDLSRRALASDLAALAAAPRLDAVGLYARFSALIEQAERLQVGSRRPEAEMTSEPDNSWLGRAEAGWRAAMAKLSSYLVIHSRSDDMAGLLTPDWENLVRQNIRMSLEQAQIAGLSANQALYAHAVGRAADSIALYAEHDPDRVAAMATELDALGTLNVAPEVPDLLASRAALADAIRSIDGDEAAADMADPSVVD